MRRLIVMGLSAIFVPLLGLGLYVVMAVWNVVDFDVRTGLVLVIVGAAAHVWGVWLGQAQARDALRW